VHILTTTGLAGSRQQERGRWGNGIRLLKVSLLAVLASFVISTLPGVRPVRFNPILDGGVQGTAYVLMALLCVLRPITDTTLRRVWRWFAAALVVRAVAFFVSLVVVHGFGGMPTPSIADLPRLAVYGCIVLGLIELARSTFTVLPTNLVLDALTSACAITGTAVMFLRGTIDTFARAGHPPHDVILTLSYPLLDLTLLVVIVGVMYAFSWSPPPALWALGAGIAGYALIDWVQFAHTVTLGPTSVSGTMIRSLSVVATALIAYAAWLPRRRERPPNDALPGLVLPGIFTLACLGLLVYATRYHVPVAAVVFTSLGVAITVARTGLTFRAVRSVAEHKREARTDELTGLANRRAFNEALADAFEGRERDDRLALLIIDLDNFKAVNDTLGHHHGDELLSHVARRLNQALRSEDLLARIGGDEFAVVLDGAGAERASQVAERLRIRLRKPFVIAGRDVDIAASIGISVFPDDGDNAVEMLQHADLAMYDAKLTGRGQSLFRPQLHQSSKERLAGVERLRGAIDAGEMVLHYQPQVSLQTGDVVGVEALVRWQHPDLGLLQPADFLHQAESGGLMRLLTMNVLQQAVQQGAVWHAGGRPVTVAVNLSVTNLLDQDFPEQVAALLSASGMEGDALELELTEDLLMADPARAGKVIDGLLKAGVTLVVDDYGTGYSSLGYLRDLKEIRGLKLDRSFVTRLDVDRRAEAIVSSTITLARSLRLDLIAEGVETESVRDRLTQLGCELAQGYLFSRPVPAESLPLSAMSRRAPHRRHSARTGVKVAGGSRGPVSTPW
jgi:diguanylate cyclase (GGDEF)-like protein